MRRRTGGGTVLVTALLAFRLLAEVSAAAETGVKPPPAGKDLTKRQPGAKYDAQHVLVRFATPGPGMPGAPGTASVERTRLLAAMGGATVVRELRIVPGLCRVKLPQGLTVEEAVARYNKLPGTVYAEPDYEARALATVPDDARSGERLGIDNITNLPARPPSNSNVGTNTPAPAPTNAAAGQGPHLDRIGVEEP